MRPCCRAVSIRISSCSIAEVHLIGTSAGTVWVVVNVNCLPTENDKRPIAIAGNLGAEGVIAAEDRYRAASSVYYGEGSAHSACRTSTAQLGKQGIEIIRYDQVVETLGRGVGFIHLIPRERGVSAV